MVHSVSLALYTEMATVFSPKGDLFLLPLLLSSLGLVLGSVHRGSVNVACDTQARNVGLLVVMWQPWLHPFLFPAFFSQKEVKGQAEGSMVSLTSHFEDSPRIPNFPDPSYFPMVIVISSVKVKD